MAHRQKSGLNRAGGYAFMALRRSALIRACLIEWRNQRPLSALLKTLAIVNGAVVDSQ